MMNDFEKAIFGTAGEEILAEFRNGQSGVYTMAVFGLLKTDPDVVHITSCETGELLYQK